LQGDWSSDVCSSDLNPVALLNAANEKAAVIGHFVVDLGDIGIQVSWIRGGKRQASCVQSVAAGGIRQRVGIERGKRIRVGTGSPGASSFRRAIWIHGP